MALNPITFLNFSASNYTLLLDIYLADRDFNEAELFDLIKKNRQNSDPKPEHIFKQLIDLKIIRSLPEATALYEITYIVKNLLVFLEQEHRFTSAAEIQAFIDELESLQSLLKAAFDADKKGHIFNILRDMSELFERLRQSSNGNRLAIIREVNDVKVNSKKETSADRYDRILYIFDRYVTPLENMIQVEKSMDVCLNRCEKLLHHAAEEYILEKDVVFKIKRAVSHLPKLRREMLTAFQESFDEITPLLNVLKDNRIARGATVVLEQVEKIGLKVLDDVEDFLALPSSRKKNELFDDSKVSDFLQDVREYEPPVCPVIDHKNATTERLVVHDFESVLDLACSELPINDVLEWIIQCCTDYDLEDILKIYSYFFNRATEFEYQLDQKKYTLKNIVILNNPLSITGL